MTVRHQVKGTLFAFPDLPPEDSEPVRKHQEARDALLRKAEKLPRKHKLWPETVKGYKPPEPGTGEFNPDAGAPGSSVEVWDPRTGETLTGQVQFPARGALKVYVSFWDGKVPTLVQLDQDKTTGSMAERRR